MDREAKNSHCLLPAGAHLVAVMDGAGTPTKPEKEMKLIGCLDLRMYGLHFCVSFLFLLTEMNILKAVLVWNNV